MKNNYFIDNELLFKIRELGFKHIVRDSIPNTKIVKIYDTESDIIYQIKNTITKRSVRFIIHLKTTNDVIMKLVFRSRNPNTVEYFDDFFSIKEEFEISVNDDIVEYLEKAKVYINSINPSLSVPFSKIDTTKKPEELNEKNLLLKVIKYVNTDESNFIFTFHDDDEVLLIAKDKKFKLPFQDDLMFRDIHGKIQFYSQAKARYHFNFIQTRKNHGNQNETSSESNHTSRSEESCCV